MNLYKQLLEKEKIEKENKRLIQNKRALLYYYKNREYVLQRQRARKLYNDQYYKEWYEKNKHRFKEYNKRSYQKNGHKYIEYRKQYRQNNKDKQKEYYDKWCKKNVVKQPEEYKPYIQIKHATPENPIIVYFE